MKNEMMNAEERMVTEAQETDTDPGDDRWRNQEQNKNSQYHLLLAEWVFGFDLQLLYILVPDLWSFSGAPALIGC